MTSFAPKTSQMLMLLRRWCRAFKVRNFPCPREWGQAMHKILLVEDNEVNREMLTRRLQRHGFSVCCAVDGAAGVAMAQSEMPDLILMDVALGEMDGWEATERIKANPA